MVIAGVIVITAIFLVLAFSMGRSLAWQHQELDEYEAKQEKQEK